MREVGRAANLPSGRVTGRDPPGLAMNRLWRTMRGPRWLGIGWGAHVRCSGSARESRARAYLETDS